MRKIIFAILVLIVLVSCATVKEKVSDGSLYNGVEIDRAESIILKEFNRFEFLESIVSYSDGSVFTTNLFEGIIYNIQDNETTVLLDFDGMLVGLTIFDDHTLVATGSTANQVPVLLQINRETGIVVNTYPIEDAMLLNGVVKLNDHAVLIADSFKGVIWKVDLLTGEATVWSDDPLLASPAPSDNVPGVNGIKIFENDIYVSNSGQMLIVKIPVGDSGKAGNGEIVKDNVFIDDFSIDGKGNIYGATHTFDSVIRISNKGELSVIALADQGVAGSTCLTWKNGKEERLLVSTNGGMSNEDQSTVVPAKIVELRIK